MGIWKLSKIEGEKNWVLPVFAQSLYIICRSLVSSFSIFYLYEFIISKFFNTCEHGQVNTFCQILQYISLIESFLQRNVGKYNIYRAIERNFLKNERRVTNSILIHLAKQQMQLKLCVTTNIIKQPDQGKILIV